MITGHDTPANIVGDNPEYWDVLYDMDSETIPAVDAFCQGYAEAMLWANTYTNVSEDDCMDVDGENSIENVDLAYAYQSPGRWWEGIGIDFTDAIDFLAANFEMLASVGGSARFGRWEQHGHDFALTRNGHGAGFWDRGYGDIGDALTDACKPYGEHNLYVDADDKIWNE